TAYGVFTRLEFRRALFRSARVAARDPAPRPARTPPGARPRRQPRVGRVPQRGPPGALRPGRPGIPHARPGQKSYSTVKRYWRGGSTWIGWWQPGRNVLDAVSQVSLTAVTLRSSSTLNTSAEM